MESSYPDLAQWSSLGEELQGPNGEHKREEILSSLDDLSRQAEGSLNSPDCEDPAKVQALIRAIGHARDIATKVFKPIDLSTL